MLVPDTTETDLAARLFQLLSGDGCQAQTASSRSGDDRTYSRRTLQTGGRRSSQSREKEFATASAAWHAYRSPTPEACFDLLQPGPERAAAAQAGSARSARRAAVGFDPVSAPSEMRMLEMIGSGYARSESDLFHLREVRRTRVFSEWELGYLLDGLAFGPVPAIAGPRRGTAHDAGRIICGIGIGLYSAKPPFADRFRQGRPRPQGRLFPPQPDRPLVGRHAPDQRQSLALESGAGEAVSGKWEQECHVASDPDI